MTSPEPTGLAIDRQALTLLRHVLAAAAPEEGCALLLGEAAAGGPWWVRMVWPALNVWQPADERRRRFALDPREQLQAQKWARARGLQVLGAAHSHPTSPPLPSASDRRLTMAPALQLIEGCGPARRRQLQAWWLPERGEPRPLMWRMVG